MSIPAYIYLLWVYGHVALVICGDSTSSTWLGAGSSGGGNPKEVGTSDQGQAD